MDRQNQWPDTPVVVICGATATGKTAAAIALAERVGGEIVNADSMQIYCGMDIGTAKPSPAERRSADFHLLDIATPDHQVSVADWKRAAEEAIGSIAAKNRVPIVCGGTGLYLRALLDDWTLAETPASPQVRAELMGWVARSGAPWLHAKLQEVDPVTAARLHPNDAIRIVRAMEVYLSTGTPISLFQERDRSTRRPRTAVRCGLTAPRPLLNARIDARVDAMLAAGLVEEVQRLLQEGYSGELGPMKSLGYREIVEYLHGELSYDSAVEESKINTRRFAKRQQTWFRADRLIQWLDVSELSSAEVAAHIQRELLQAGHSDF
ncbi:MAG: tRNA dimethylallyltransferase [Chthonomonadaceae bacterium]|nr:tRNA dimethylallyltransferase [Chthonomonadaceae bacterium]